MNKSTSSFRPDIVTACRIASLKPWSCIKLKEPVIFKTFRCVRLKVEKVAPTLRELRANSYLRDTVLIDATFSGAIKLIA